MAASMCNVRSARLSSASYACAGRTREAGHVARTTIYVNLLPFKPISHDHNGPLTSGYTLYHVLLCVCVCALYNIPLETPKNHKLWAIVRPFYLDPLEQI